MRLQLLGSNCWYTFSFEDSLGQSKYKLIFFCSVKPMKSSPKLFDKSNLHSISQSEVDVIVEHFHWIISTLID